MSNAEIFRKAADYIREHGWRRAGFGEHGEPRCALGALSSAVFGPLSVRGLVKMGIADNPVRYYGSIASARLGQALDLWNDAKGQTADQVIALFDGLAFDEDLKAAATADNPASGVMETSNPVEQTHDTASPSLLKEAVPVG